MTAPEELRGLVESYLGELALTPELGGLEESMRHALAGGGKRVRPVLCLATAEAAGAEPEAALPAAAALELVHNFSLVHDDLPALDNDEQRRGRPSTWAAYGEAVAVLAGDALLAEALRLALLLPVAGGRARARAGDARDDRRAVPRHQGGGDDLAALHRLKTGCLFSASVACALWVAEVPESEQKPWRAFADEVGLLFQIVDDILDEDGYVLEHGAEGARALADEAAERARRAPSEVDADTSVLEGIVDDLAVRTS